MSVTLLEVMAAARARKASLAGETAGYLVLAAADQALGACRSVEPAETRLLDDGSVRLAGGTSCDEVSAEAALRSLLQLMLPLSAPVSPALLRAGGRSAGAGVSMLIRELEAALVPANRAAARRSLARLCRETERAKEQGLLVGEAPRTLPESESSGAALPARGKPTPAGGSASNSELAVEVATDLVDEAPSGEATRSKVRDAEGSVGGAIDDQATSGEVPEGATVAARPSAEPAALTNLDEDHVMVRHERPLGEPSPIPEPVELIASPEVLRPAFEITEVDQVRWSEAPISAPSAPASSAELLVDEAAAEEAVDQVTAPEPAVMRAVARRAESAHVVLSSLERTPYLGTRMSEPATFVREVRETSAHELDDVLSSLEISDDEFIVLGDTAPEHELQGSELTAQPEASEAFIEAKPAPDVIEEIEWLEAEQVTELEAALPQVDHVIVPVPVVQVGDDTNRLELSTAEFSAAYSDASGTLEATLAFPPVTRKGSLPQDELALLDSEWSKIPPSVGPKRPGAPPQRCPPAPARYQPRRSEVSELLANFKMEDSPSVPAVCRELKSMAGLDPTPLPAETVSYTPPPVFAGPKQSGAESEKRGSRLVPTLTLSVGAFLAAALVGSSSQSMDGWLRNATPAATHSLPERAALERSTQRTSEAVGDSACRATLTVRGAHERAVVKLRAARAELALPARQGRGPEVRFDALPCGEALEVSVTRPDEPGQVWERIPISGEELLPGPEQRHAQLTVIAR